MADEVDSKSWIAELESALKEDFDPDSVYGGGTIPDELRSEVWRSCLGITNNIAYLDEIFDLPEQNVIRQDCQQFVEKLGNEDEDKVSVLSDLETILTYHRKKCGVEYKKGNGWIELLLPLLALKVPRCDTYCLFEAIVSKYIPRGNSPYSLLRLLILYHDPELCSFFDTKRITPDTFATSWFQSLFAAECNLQVVTAIWDLYFQQADNFFLLFLGLVMVMNARGHIIGMKNDSKEDVISFLNQLPCRLQVEDVQDFCSLAQFYSKRTPGSFRQDLERVIFDDEDCPEDEQRISQALCLPVSVYELVENINLPAELDDGVRFFLVDCRPAEHYNAGHLPTAFHLDCNLMLHGGEIFKTAVQGLLSSQGQALAAGSAAGGEHLCFMGCGSLEHDQYTHMVVASFLRNNTQYVSLLNGGYQALHQYFQESIGNVLSDHSPASCQVCLTTKVENPQSPNGPQSPSKDLFGKIGAAVKMKSAEVKEKLLEYIVNPGGNETIERHVKPTDKMGKRYRNIAPVFSIDDDQEPPEVPEDEEDDDDDSPYETVKLSQWLKRSDIVAKFSCEELKVNKGMYKSELLVSETHIYVLRRTAKKDIAKLVVRKPLLAIGKITCRKKFPELITFKYGSAQGDTLTISDMDKFIIPEANEVIAAVSKQIDLLAKKTNGQSSTP